ncbi:MAG: energy-coupling factor transporter ATPase [Eggerthellaceae bacterium]|nr:energy-coupling factor transporter ATPase [Eggerthellaceae bacterium]
MIDIEHIRFTYDGQRFALNDVSAHVGAGEFVCVLGGNGSGKSTLAKHVNALLLPDEGRVTVDGLDTAQAENLYLIRSNAGMVFQNPDDQLVASLVEDDVAFGPENLGLPSPEIAARVYRALREVGLVGFERHETHALSGGQKQRVAIAGVLAMQPKVLVLDEASAMLDPRGRAGLMRVCRELNEQGMTIVMITHFMEEAALADRVIVLDGGRVALSGTPEEVLTRADVLAPLNLEVPFACKLSRALEARGVDVPVCVSEDALVEELGKQAVACGVREGASVDAGADEQAAPPSVEQPVVISFRNVSYTYDAPLAKQQKKRAKKDRKTASAANACDAASATDAAPTPNPDAPKWGNSPDAAWALRDVTLDVREGEFLGIAGHTGSGKSTLIQHMNGILQPSAGRVEVCGADVSDKRAATAVRAKVGVVFQYPEHQLFADTVYNDVAFGPRNLGLMFEEVDARVHEALTRVGLDADELAAKSPFELSGGQQRRVAFAGVLAMRPQILVLDEPVAGLDPAARRDFLNLIRGLHEQGLTVVMVSHCMDDLAALCDRIAVMKEGTLLREGAPREVFLHEDVLRAVGLGVPAAQHVANRLRAEGLPLDDGVLYGEETLANAVAHALAPKEAQ